MSDSDGSGSEEYEFEYSDEDSMEEDEDVEIQNQYHTAKDVMDSDPLQALQGFNQVLSLEEERGLWGFKARKQRVKIFFMAEQFDEMLAEYRELLTFSNCVTRNEFEKILNNILNFVTVSNRPDVLLEIFEVTLHALENANNDRLWFNTTIQLGKLYFEARDFSRLQKVIKSLHRFCENPDGTYNERNDTQLLEVYALEIQQYTEQKNNKKLEELYNKSLQVRSAIPHPRIMGIIRECGGKMFMGKQQYDEALGDFFEAFKSFDEAGDVRRIQCLKYAVLASMLSSSDFINRLESQEAKAYMNDPEVEAMNNLVRAYEENNVREFQEVLQNNRSIIMEDAFIRNYVETLLASIRTQVLLKLIQPYRKLRISYVSEELLIPESEVENLLVNLILDEQIHGHIDQVQGLLILSEVNTNEGSRRYRGLDEWASSLLRISNSLFSRATAST